MKTLVIVESPNKVKKLSQYLGPGYIVKASVGHVVDLAQEGFGNYGIDIDNGYKPKYKMIDNKKQVVSNILTTAQSVDQIYLATDPDREGEAIAFHLRDLLKKLKKPFYRITFNAITKDAVQKAIKNPGQLNENLFDAQQARRVVDRIVGFGASPLLMKLLGPDLSAGRVQSVATRLIVDRDREIESFVPEKYWNITAQLAKSAKDESFSAKYSKEIKDEKIAKKIKSDLDNDTFKITKVESKEKLRNPPPPLTTSRLQQLAASKCGLSVTKTMKAAQGLYEGGHITYLRTDSVRCTPESIEMVRDYLKDNNFPYPKKPNVYSSKDSAQDAHEAIRPTDVSKKASELFTDKEQIKVYELIWNTFVASQMDSAVYDTMSITIESSSKHELKANGRTLKSPGFLAISKDFDEDSSSDVKLPLLKEKDDLILVPPKIKLEEKQTQPPPRYGEGSLVKELDKRGIGRPSTYGDIVEKIKGRGYVELQGKTYHSTEKGRKVIDFLKNSFKFMEYEYTANMESQLDKISEGNLNYIDMVDSFYSTFNSEMNSAKKAGSEGAEIVCPKCAMKMEKRKGKFGEFYSCIDYPNCKGIINIKSEKNTDRKPEKVYENIKCDACNIGMVKRKGMFGEFYACRNYPKCKEKKKI